MAGLTLKKGFDYSLAGENRWSAVKPVKIANGTAFLAAAVNSGEILGTATVARAYQSRCVGGKVFQKYYADGQDKVLLFYQSFRKPGSATLRGRLTGQPIVAHYNLDGAPVDISPDGVNHMRVVEGTNIQHRRVEVAVVRACYDALGNNIATWRSWFDHVNSDNLTYINASPGWILYGGFEYQPVEIGSITLWYVDHYLKITPYTDSSGNPISWNEGCKSQLVLMAAQEVPVLNLTLGDTEDTVVKQVPVPDTYMDPDDGSIVGPTPGSRQINAFFYGAAMSSLDLMLG